MAAIESSIAARLLSDPAVTAVLGKRIYPDDLPAQLPSGPRAEIDLTDEQSPVTLDGYGGGTFAVSVTVYARLKSQANAAREAVRESLDGHAGGEVRAVWWDTTAAVETEAGFAYVLAFVGRTAGRAEPSAVPSNARLSEDGTARTTEDGIPRILE